MQGSGLRSGTGEEKCREMPPNGKGGSGCLGALGDRVWGGHGAAASRTVAGENVCSKRVGWFPFI